MDFGTVQGVWNLFEVSLAEKYNISLTKLALAFVNMQPFVTSNIIGATTMDQLKENIETFKTAQLTTEQRVEVEKEFSSAGNQVTNEANSLTLANLFLGILESI